MSADSVDVNQDTLGHEADNLLRTVVRAFLDNSEADGLADTCSIVLDIILRNHYHTCEEDIARLCKIGKGGSDTKIRKALGILVANHILVFENRLHKKDEYRDELMAAKERQVPHRMGYQRFNYERQQAQETEEEYKQKQRQKKAKNFFYVDYHKAVEFIRARLWIILHDDEQVGVVYKCRSCGHEYDEEEYQTIMAFNNYRPLCKLCSGTIGKIVPKTCLMRSKFLDALRPIINLVNEVLKKTYEPFVQYSPEELRLIEDHKREEEKKNPNSSYTDDVVEIQEDLNPCPGARAKSERVHNCAIPWFVHKGFFSTNSAEEEEENYAAEDDSDAKSPDAKRPRISDDAKTVVSLSELTQEDKVIMFFDRDLLEHLELRSPEEMDLLVPDTVSIRSGSTFSADDQDNLSDMEMPASALSSPLQQQQQKLNAEHMVTMKVCRGFDDDVIASRAVSVAGELRPLDSLTQSDLNRMTDDEYVAYANEIALVSGIS